ncbi:MAG: hypothetical protein H0X33_07550 [Taibaiella sp.]|nr:hypothetical protein [Taibaiella sp.]
MKKIFLIAGGLITTLFFVGCSKSGSTYATNPSGTSNQMSYQLKTTNSTASLQRTTALSTIQWTSGFANPTLVKFEAKQGTSELEFKSTNTAQIDLMSSVASTFGAFTLPNGIYTEVELKIDLSENGSNPSLELNGQFVNASGNVPVSFQVYEDLELKTEQHTITVDSTMGFLAITTFDLASLTTGVTETLMLAATRSAGDTIVISHSSNKNIYDIIVNNFKGKDHHCDIEHHK